MMLSVRLLSSLLIITRMLRLGVARLASTSHTSGLTAGRSGPRGALPPHGATTGLRLRGIPALPQGAHRHACVRLRPRPEGARTKGAGLCGRGDALDSGRAVFVPPGGMTSCMWCVDVLCSLVWCRSVLLHAKSSCAGVCASDSDSDSLWQQPDDAAASSPQQVGVCVGVCVRVVSLSWCVLSGSVTLFTCVLAWRGPCFPPVSRSFFRDNGLMRNADAAAPPNGDKTRATGRFRQILRCHLDYYYYY